MNSAGVILWNIYIEYAHRCLYCGTRLVGSLLLMYQMPPMAPSRTSHSCNRTKETIPMDCTVNLWVIAERFILTKKNKIRNVSIRNQNIIM